MAGVELPGARLFCIDELFEHVVNAHTGSPIAQGSFSGEEINLVVMPEGYFKAFSNAQERGCMGTVTVSWRS